MPSVSRNSLPGPWHPLFRALFKLAKRMVTNFCIGASGAPHPSWTPISYSGPEGSATLRIQARKNTNNPGEPTGIILSASSSFYLDSPPQQVFNFLTNQRLRQQVGEYINHSTLNDVGIVLQSVSIWVSCFVLIRRP